MAAASLTGAESGLRRDIFEPEFASAVKRDERPSLHCVEEPHVSINRNAILARLEIVADCLDLSEQDLRAIAEDDERLIEFAIEYGQSLDWLVMGDVRNYIRMAALKH